MHSNVLFEPKLVDTQNYYFFEKGFTDEDPVNATKFPSLPEYILF